jgi:hypothetical protein
LVPASLASPLRWVLVAAPGFEPCKAMLANKALHPTADPPSIK